MLATLRGEEIGTSPVGTRGERSDTHLKPTLTGIVERPLWEYVVGGATVFGLIVALGAWVNGRVTRREISRLIAEEHRATRELIAKIDERLAKMDEHFARMDEHFARIDERFAKMDERFEALLKESSEGHARILEAIKELSRKRRARTQAKKR